MRVEQLLRFLVPLAVIGIVFGYAITVLGTIDTTYNGAHYTNSTYRHTEPPPQEESIEQDYPTPCNFWCVERPEQ